MKYSIRTLAILAVCATAISACNTTNEPEQKPLQAAISDAPVDYLQPEIQRRNDLIEWSNSMQKIAAEQAEYDAAQEAAMLARNATGDYGEVFEP